MLTHDRLLEVLNYNPETGIFIWKVQTAKRIKVGSEAGCKTCDGYLASKIDGKSYLLHRLAWFYIYGVWPNFEIDHKNTIRHNNWIDNLRDARKPQNGYNRGKNINNTSGYKGVSWHKASQKWQSRIGVEGKRIVLGFFDCPIEAHNAYIKAAEEMHKEYKNIGQD